VGEAAKADDHITVPAGDINSADPHSTCHCLAIIAYIQFSWILASGGINAGSCIN